MKKREKEYQDNIILKEKRFETRKPILEKLGFTWDEKGGSFYIACVYSSYWETIVNATDGSFADHIVSIKKAIADDAKKQLDIQKEREENARIAKIEADKLAKELAENARLNKIEADKAEAERLKLEAENKRLKAIQEAAELAHEQEKRRIADEEAELKAREKAELNAPDKLKLRAYYDKFIALEVPEFTSEEGKLIGAEIAEAKEIIKQLMIRSAF